MTEETCKERLQVERLDRTQPPPIPGLVRGAWAQVWAIPRSAGVWYTLKELWGMWELEYDPPGLHVFTDDGSGSSWHFARPDDDALNEQPHGSREAARAAAWAHYWRRAALPDGDWPECLAWVDEYVALVERLGAEGVNTSEVPHALA